MLVENVVSDFTYL